MTEQTTTSKQQTELCDVLAAALHAASGVEESRHGHEWLSRRCTSKRYGDSCAEQATDHAAALAPRVLAWHLAQIAEAEKRGAIKAADHLLKEAREAEERDCQPYDVLDHVQVEARRIVDGGDI